MARQARAPTTPDRIRARKKLEELWGAILIDDGAGAPQNLQDLVNSGQTAIRFCLPTQLLGKLVDPALDALCLQKGDGTRGRWDPRGFASAVIVPWNRDNQSVLGNSGDPYVSNPLRRPRVDAGLDQMADREQWDSLCEVLRDVEKAGDPAQTERVLSQVLIAIRDRLRALTFVYVVPSRVSLRQVEALVGAFLSESSGGDRGLAVTAALFETFREHIGLYREVRRSVVNAADAATNSVGDLECVGPDGDIILAVEVKERRIEDADVQIAVAKAREFAVRELLLCTKGIQTAEHDAVERTFSNAWASGTNLYHATVGDLMRGTLPLVGETGIRNFVVQIGHQLDTFSSQPRHRKAWKTLLDAL
jgi:hypothetical protein